MGILLFLERTQFDSLNTISRHSSRTTQHTQLDYIDMIHHVAYIITTRHVGKTYYSSNQLDNPPYLLNRTYIQQGYRTTRHHYTRRRTQSNNKSC